MSQEKTGETEELTGLYWVSERYAIDMLKHGRVGQMANELRYGMYKGQVRWKKKESGGLVFCLEDLHAIMLEKLERKYKRERAALERKRRLQTLSALRSKA